MKIDLKTIKVAFETGNKPTQQQFWNTFDSFWHKDETLPLIAVKNLPEMNTTLESLKTIDFVDKQYLDDSLKGLARSSELDKLAKSTELDSLAKSSELSGLAHSSELNSLAKSSELNGLAHSSELDSLAKSSELSGLAHSSELDSLAKSSELTGLLNTQSFVNAINSITQRLIKIDGDIDRLSSQVNQIPTP